ncbi:MAG TPA: hypothetical protein VNO22_02925 [Planctomycetota bacterium]|nr:hypothetical protein [Planctomycetota bacterium]
MMLKSMAVAAALAALAWMFQEGGRPQPGRGIVAVQADEVKWERVEGMPAGVQAAHAAGEGEQAHVTLLKFAAGTRLALHRHTPDLVVTVLRGSILLGTEGRPDPARGTRVGAGGYFKIRGGAPHWTIAPEEAILVVSSQGPLDTKWEEPEPPRD